MDSTRLGTTATVSSTALSLVGAALVALAFFAQGCAHVPAYDRALLAHPTMTSGTLAGPGEAHVYAIQEGAIGGAIGAESGCGCN